MWFIYQKGAFSGGGCQGREGLALVKALLAVQFSLVVYFMFCRGFFSGQDQFLEQVAPESHSLLTSRSEDVVKGFRMTGNLTSPTWAHLLLLKFGHPQQLCLVMSHNYGVLCLSSAICDVKMKRLS